MPRAARITDPHSCPMVNPGPSPHVGGPVVKGLPTVLTGKLPQSRVSDSCICLGPTDVIVKGSATVLVGGSPAARMGDRTAHGGVIVAGCATVLIGEAAGGGGPASLAHANGAAQRGALLAAAATGVPFCQICSA